MKAFSTIFGPALFAGVLAASVCTSHGQSIYTHGHTDIGLDYRNGALVPHWHLDAGNIVDGQPLDEESEYAPEALVAQFSGLRGSASGSLDYLSVPTGTPIYMGGPSVSWQPYLGFGTEELDPGEWLGGRITFSLMSWTAPTGGNFSLYATNVSGTATIDIFLSTYDPSVANIDGIGQNAFYLFAGAHEHYTFGFTTPGTYELTLMFSGEHSLGGLASASGTFGFVVVPEPSIGHYLIFSGVAGLLLWRWRPASSGCSLA